MTQKKALWAILSTLLCWALLPTMLSYFWSFQDYFQDWASARNWWEGIAVYSPHRVTVPRYLGVDYATLPEGKVYGILATVKVNAHPPSSVLFYLPLALLPYGLSFFVWNLLAIACLVLAAGIVACELELRPSPWHLLWMGPLGLLGGPLFEHMVFGQSSTLILLMLVLAWRAQRRGRQTSEGCWLGLAVAFKLFPLALLMIPLAGQRWRAVAAALGTTLFILLLSVLVFGLDVWPQYIHTGLREAVVWGDLWANASLSGFWKKLFVSQNRGLVVTAWASSTGFWSGYVLSTAVVGLTTLWLAIAGARAANDDSPYAAGMCAMLLLSPVCWPGYFLMLLLPVALLWQRCPTSSLSRWVLIGSVALLLVPPGLSCAFCGVHWDYTDSAISPYATFTVLSLQTYALSGLWMLAVTRELGGVRNAGTLPSLNQPVVSGDQLAA